ncbi:MAG: hypothetical protein H6737_02010 [Alphaproteobacteria bacterium]|nr:hypothetical protein [Alphaproteobacteria bacterium]
MFFTLLALLGCPGEEPIDETLSGCDTLDPSNCLFPFPSDYFVVDDATAPSGRRVAYGPTALPVNLDGVQLDPLYWNEKDGYSINSNMMFYFADGSHDGLWVWSEVDRYAAADAKTVLLDLDTGERVPHWVELDASADDPAESAYVMRTAIPLEYEHHYAVAVRGLVKTAGGPVDVSDAFRKLRDGEATRDWDVEHRRERFDTEIFPALEAAGFPRGELQLAWDFHTVSRENSLGRMVWMRDDALSGLPASGPAYTVASSEDHDCTAEGATIGRTVELEVTAPLYTEVDDAGTVLTRDENGMPFRNGETQFDVLVRIPCSVIENPGPSRVLQYGHGLLGSRSEARTGWLSRLADENGWIIVSTDWTGMSEDDVGEIVYMSAADPSRFAMIPERGMQGMVQQLLVLPLLRGALKDDPVMQVGGTTLVHPTDASYYGNSQGAIMGAAFMALTQEIPRGVLGVSGVNYGLLLTRSHDFDIYFLIFKQKFSDGRDIALLIQGLTQQVWDPAEGAGYLWAINRDPLPDTPAKDILIHTAIGDNQVTTIGGQIQARAYGAKLVGPTHRDVWGVESSAPGFTGSALVEWHYSDAAIEYDDNTPPDGPDPHECPRREPASYEQVRDFLVDGVVNHYCDGVCSSTVAEVCPG